MRARALVCAIGLCLVLAACGSGSSSPGGGAGGTAASGSRTLTVFAAASLTDTFTALGKKFEESHLDVSVRFNYAGSSTLAQQIVQGAPADVFAAANTETMKTVTDAGGTEGEPAIFATNILEIATQPGNPKQITGFASLADPGLKVVVCAPAVPCGAVTQQVEQNTGIQLSPVSEEQSVTAVLTKVTTGNADAGLVYVTDVKSAGDRVTGVPFPEADAAPTDYPIAALSKAPQPELAQQFVDMVIGPDGQQILQTAGFGSP
ncbi:molybdate ABC transporter substrate-binding protein [Pseudonocardia sp.]|uniref:molybdate ABC transporter substrate-binding protein n=1 Tax=Pseudonocardia sp. TaxID=60912 RepID=UPI003D09B3CC